MRKLEIRWAGTFGGGPFASTPSSRTRNSATRKGHECPLGRVVGERGDMFSQHEQIHRRDSALSVAWRWNERVASGSTPEQPRDWLYDKRNQESRTAGQWHALEMAATC